jgi:hypothetical protein
LNKNRVPLDRWLKHSKLCPDQVVEIRRRYRQGERKASLARSFGVTPHNVTLIVENKMWKHVLPSDEEGEIAQ